MFTQYAAAAAAVAAVQGPIRTTIMNDRVIARAAAFVATLWSPG